MATDQHLKRIEALLSPTQGESSGYITRDDILASFREALLAVAEQQIYGEDSVVGTLQQKYGKGGQTLIDILDSLGDTLARWDATVDVLGGTAPRTTPEVGGDVVPGTIAATVQVLNNLIQALEAQGLVRDIRGVVPPVPPQPPVPVTGMTRAGTGVHTFTPVNATLPADLAALVADATVGDAALSGAGIGAWARGDYIVLGDGSRATWDGTNWGVWTPPVTGITPPTGVGVFEWTFLPTGALPVADLATLKADAVVGDAVLQAAANVDFTTGQFIVLGDGSRAFFSATAGGAPVGTFEWQVGVAP